MAFLSDEWFAVTASKLDAVTLAAPDELVVQHDVATSDGTVSFHLHLAGGRVRLERGAHARPDVRVSTERDTAEAIRRGDLAALDAIDGGVLHIDGDVSALLAAAEDLAVIDAVMTAPAGPGA